MSLIEIFLYNQAASSSLRAVEMLPSLLLLPSPPLTMTTMSISSDLTRKMTKKPNASSRSELPPTQPRSRRSLPSSQRPLFSWTLSPGMTKHQWTSWRSVSRPSRWTVSSGEQTSLFQSAMASTSSKSCVLSKTRRSPSTSFRRRSRSSRTTFSPATSPPWTRSRPSLISALFSSSQLVMIRSSNYFRKISTAHFLLF